MKGWLRRSLDDFIGAGEAAVTVPAMDGALKPNRALDDVTRSIPLREPDNLIRRRDDCMCSSRNQLFTIEIRGDIARAAPGRNFDSLITAIAESPDGGLAVAVESGQIILVDGKFDGRIISRLGTTMLRAVAAMCFIDADNLVICAGSAENSMSDWQKDLLEGCSSGSVWRINLASDENDCLAKDLAFPFGVLPIENGRGLVVSESWRHRLLRIDVTRASSPKVILEDLPGYPARICNDAKGRSWLAVFAPRNQLVEFVMREPEYRNRMMETIPSAYWIAPALRSRVSFHEPLQGGAMRQMGLIKPWAPTRSCGLVVELGAEWQPKSSLHSRADGHRHGVTSCLFIDELLLIASKGGNEIVLKKV